MPTPPPFPNHNASTAKQFVPFPGGDRTLDDGVALRSRFDAGGRRGCSVLRYTPHGRDLRAHSLFTIARFAPLLAPQTRSRHVMNQTWSMDGGRTRSKKKKKKKRRERLPLRGVQPLRVTIKRHACDCADRAFGRVRPGGRRYAPCRPTVVIWFAGAGKLVNEGGRTYGDGRNTGQRLFPSPGRHARALA